MSGSKSENSSKKKLRLSNYSRKRVRWSEKIAVLCS